VRGGRLLLRLLLPLTPTLSPLKSREREKIAPLPSQCAALRNTVEAMSPAARAIATVMRP
jgi:hypothetical protein